MNFCWTAASILLGTGSGFFQSKPMRFISLISPDLPYSMPNRLRMNCPTSTVDAGRTSIAQARSSSIWEGRQRAGSTLEIEQDEFFDSTFVEGFEPVADGRIVDEQRLGDLGVGPTLVEQKNGVRPASDAMLLQPIPGDLHQVGPIRRAEEIAVRFHQATGIDPADSVKRFFGCPRIPAISRRRLAVRQCELATDARRGSSAWSAPFLRRTHRAGIPPLADEDASARGRGARNEKDR